jgi:thiamine-monophosphate kinase
VYAGLRECADAYGCPVIGGDVSSGPSLALAVTVLGRTPQPVLRSTGRPGDLLAVTGPLGGSAVGLALLEGRVELPDGVAAAPIRRHRRPQPRLAEGRALAGVVHAMMDVSDGVASDASRIAEASGVTVVVDLDALPLDDGVAECAAALRMAPGAFAAAGGEDYELLVAIGADALAGAPVPLHAIGRLEAGPVAVRFTGQGARPDLAGWKH